MQKDIGQAAEAAHGRLAALFVRHAADSIRLGYLLTGDRALAEDLVQEAFVRLAGRFADVRNPEAFPGYLRTTVVNLSRMHFRRRKVERAYLEREGQRPSIDASSPEVEEHERLKRALLRLPERQRAALVLRFYEDLSERDTADTLRCRPGTVKSLVSRALASMRDELRGAGDG
jgi:RNA polymerase sigma-70 factor (sigma-E family)